MKLHIPHWRLMQPAVLVMGCLVFAGTVFARDDEYQRLADRFDRLAADPAVSQHAPAELDRARAALAALKDAKRSQHDEMAYVAERRIEIARVSAESKSLEDQRVSLQRENDRLQLAQARRDAAQARAELERQRLQSQIRAEEAERARADAEAARAQGAQATLEAEAARAEADQAKRVTAAQAKAATLARREAELTGATKLPPPARKLPKKRVPVRGKSPADGKTTGDSTDGTH